MARSSSIASGLRNYYAYATWGEKWSFALPLALVGCAGPGIFHAQLLAGSGPDPGSYRYVELIEAPGEAPVARAVEALDGQRARVLGDLLPEEAEAARQASQSTGIAQLPTRLGSAGRLRILDPPSVGASWPLSIPPSEKATLAVEATKDRFGTPVYAFVVKTPDGKRSGWAGEVPSDRARIVRIAVLDGERRAVVEVAFDRSNHKTIAIYDLDLSSGIARLLDEEAVERLGAKSYDEARDRLERALQMNPDDATARYNLACLLALTGRSDEAMRELASALRIDPHYLAITARHDPDLDSLRQRPDFKAVVGPKGEAAEP